MSVIDRAGYWRVTENIDGVAAELLDDQEGYQLLLEGDRIVRVEKGEDGSLIGYQNSGAIMNLPSGQAMPTSARFTIVDWDHE